MRALLTIGQDRARTSASDQRRRKHHKVPRIQHSDTHEQASNQPDQCTRTHHDIGRGGGVGALANDRVRALGVHDHTAVLPRKDRRHPVCVWRKTVCECESVCAYRHAALSRSSANTNKWGMRMKWRRARSRNKTDLFLSVHSGAGDTHRRTQHTHTEREEKSWEKRENWERDE